jgi:hypothetical protein
MIKHGWTNLSSLVPLKMKKKDKYAVSLVTVSRWYAGEQTNECIQNKERKSNAKMLNGN